MVKVWVTIDPQTGRALYRDEETCMGVFESVAKAAEQIGHHLMRFCSIRAAQ